MSPDFTIIDEFAEMPEIGDEWIDRHGVDRSPDAEGQRVDDAYERMVQDKMKADLDRPRVPVVCQFCQIPNGVHHPDCANAPAKRLTAQEKLGIAVEAEILKSIELGIEESEKYGIPMIWKIDAGTQVYVSDNEGVLRNHQMKKDAVYSEEQMVGREVHVEMPFVLPFKMGHKLNTTLEELIERGWVVVETGVDRWPYLIVLQKHAIVLQASLEGFVGRSGGTCRKLGY